MVSRFDVSTTKNWELDDRQRLIVQSTPTRSGVFTYYEPNGRGGFNKVRELRHPDDVFSSRTLNSLNGIPYTVQKNHTSLMKPSDVTGKTYGYTLSGAKRTDNHSDIPIKINDGGEIKAVTSGESLELSCGYTCDIIKESGRFDGEDYDQKQTNIIYDHVARVEKARGGESCRIRLDSECAICGVEAERLDSGELTTSHSEGIMAEPKKVVLRDKELPERASAEFRLDADQITIPQEQDANFLKMKDREDKLFAALETAGKTVTESQVKLDAANSKIKDLEKEVENTIPREKLDSAIDDRLKVYALAQEHGVESYREKPFQDVKKEIATASKLFNEEKLDNADYLDFAIDLLQDETAKNKSRSRKNLELHQGGKGKFDSAGEGDLTKKSRLEKA